jgi:hypothetical protein
MNKHHAVKAHKPGSQAPVITVAGNRRIFLIQALLLSPNTETEGDYSCVSTLVGDIIQNTLKTQTGIRRTYTFFNEQSKEHTFNYANEYKILY